MRIRKNASKLLGSASFVVFPPPPPPPSPPPSTAVDFLSGSGSGVVCELNRSMWDAFVADSSYGFAYSKEEEEEDGGIMGNGIRYEEEQITAITSTAAGLNIKEKKKRRKELDSRIMDNKVKQKKRKKKKDVAATDQTIRINTTRCKKNDGKGWHCKRPVQHHHSLCDYHLGLLQSYNATIQNPKVSDSAEAAAANGRTRRSNTSADAAGENSDFYYYYSGFGPSKGKRRGRGSNDHSIKEEEVVQEEEEEESRESSAYNAPLVFDELAGDDEYDLDALDDDDDDSLENGIVVKEGEDEKKRILKKRGRKPVKARSLKSLL